MLNTIVLQQKKDIQLQKSLLPLEKIQALLRKSDRDFMKAMLSTSNGYIFECKLASPSSGKLREDYPVTKLAKQYANYANALSVLTNERFFAGNFNHLKEVSKVVQVPLLCKDIIIDQYQIALARLNGANAILLMLSVLDDKMYLALKDYALSLNMTVLTEVFSEQELIRANQLHAHVIVVNHRDLNTMQVDMMRLNKLAPYLDKKAYIIAASGIQNYQDIKQLKPYAQGFLIGSSLSKSPALNHTLKDLRFGPIKICGLTRQEDVNLASTLGATYGGLIFVPSSLRKVTFMQAKKIVQGKLKFVGVFANQPPEEVANIAKGLKLFAVQLHGQEDAEYINALYQKLGQSSQIWQAIDGNLPLLQTLPPFVDKLIVDNKGGGTGQTFAWDKLNNSPLKNNMILAGGISSENILKAKSYGMYGMDINSGVELAPGIKDAQKLTKLFQLLKQGAFHENT
ncbi:MAG: bifunctional indole-3-glycerol-phosphate synthase TrpC/phosphoribosylanthranilate isomerase TrpF [Proteobacteria bacterium]|nr:bifunctional indole-3-glycerol-phosphate synthase TrpC/phosphoribosylanthranilate isomerase TrpF [Pseudomonadota bacterium]